MIPKCSTLKVGKRPILLQTYNLYVVGLSFLYKGLGPSSPQHKKHTTFSYPCFHFPALALVAEMSQFYKPKNDLAKIGDDAFALLDGFSGWHKSKASSSVPSSHTTKHVFHSQYQPDSAYVVRRKVYVTPVQTMRNEKVMDSYEAAKMFGGTVILDYPKRKPSRWSIFKK